MYIYYYLILFDDLLSFLACRIIIVLINTPNQPLILCQQRVLYTIM